MSVCPHRIELDCWRCPDCDAGTGATGIPYRPPMTTPKHPPPASGNGAPFDERLPDAQSDTETAEALISQINAPVDPDSAMAEIGRLVAAGAQRTADVLHYGPELEWRQKAAEARAVERARCRAIVLRLFGSEWRGNEALEAIDNGH